MSIGRRKEVQGLINFINSLTTNQFIYFHKSFSFLHIGNYFVNHFNNIHSSIIFLFKELINNKNNKEKHIKWRAIGKYLEDQNTQRNLSFWLFFY